MTDKTFKYEFDGDKVAWQVKGSHIYYTTNDSGEGVFCVNPAKNCRKQLMGTCDFYLVGSKAAKRAKIRRFMYNYYGQEE